jgi:hypothetical protein
MSFSIKSAKNNQIEKPAEKNLDYPRTIEYQQNNNLKKEDRLVIGTRLNSVTIPSL